MLLEPGPIPPIPEATYDSTEDDSTFSALTDAETTDLITLEDIMDGLLSNTVTIDPDPPDDGIGTVLDDIGAALSIPVTLPGGGVGNPGDALQAAYDGAAGVDQTDAIAQTDSLYKSAAEQLVTVYDATPSEAFQPVPDSLGDFDPNNPPPDSWIDHLTITNLTRPNATDWWPGDQYQIQLQISPAPGGATPIEDVLITLFYNFAGTEHNQFPVGTTNQNGVLCLQGTWGFDAVGSWVVDLYGTWPGLQNFSFLGELDITVSPLPAGQPWPATLNGPNQAVGFNPTLCEGNPPPASNITVTLDNTTTPGSTSYKVGDNWTLTVTGTPNAPVLIRATHDGAELGWENLGTTDENGVFQWSYFMPDDTYVGQWQEWYQVGSIAWSGSLVFSVTAD